MSALLRRGIVGQFGSFAPRLVLVVGLTALASMGCGPSIDAAAKADIDGRVAALHASSDSFPAPTDFVPMPLVAGQWKKKGDKAELVIVANRPAPNIPTGGKLELLS